MAYLFISHDLDVVRLLCDRLCVLQPQHPVTQSLIASRPCPGYAEEGRAAAQPTAGEAVRRAIAK